MPPAKQLIVVLILTFGSAGPATCQRAATPGVSVGAQYDSTHVYVASDDFDRLVGSVVATFGGTTSKQVTTTVTPTPSSTLSQVILTPVGTFSVFGYKTPVPYPFGTERTGYLVSDMDKAILAARMAGANVIVSAFNDPIGRDTIIQFPEGLTTQLYIHTAPPSYKALEKVPENRVYASPDGGDALIRSFLAFSQGRIVSDDEDAPGIEIGRPVDTYRRVRIESGFGKMTVLVTDGHLPFPFGRETTGYEVDDLADTLRKAKSAGAQILVTAYKTNERQAAVVEFPGGYIAEIHSEVQK